MIFDAFMESRRRSTSTSLYAERVSDLSCSSSRVPARSNPPGELRCSTFYESIVVALNRRSKPGPGTRLDIRGGTGPDFLHDLSLYPESRNFASRVTARCVRNVHVETAALTIGCPFNVVRSHARWLRRN